MTKLILSCMMLCMAVLGAGAEDLMPAAGHTGRSLSLFGKFGKGFVGGNCGRWQTGTAFVGTPTKTVVKPTYTDHLWCQKECKRDACCNAMTFDSFSRRCFWYTFDQTNVQTRPSTGGLSLAICEKLGNTNNNFCPFNSGNGVGNGNNGGNGVGNGNNGGNGVGNGNNGGNGVGNGNNGGNNDVPALPPCGGGAPACNPTTCDKWEVHTEFVGTPIRTVRKTTYTDHLWCHKECMKDATCNAMTFDSHTRECFWFRLAPNFQTRPKTGGLSRAICNKFLVCPVGQGDVNGICVPSVCGDGQVLFGNECRCAAGEELVNDACVPIKCTDNEVLLDNQCEVCLDGDVVVDNACVLPCQDNEVRVGLDCQACAAGEEVVAGACEPITCATGEELKGNTCEPIPCGGQDEIVCASDAAGTPECEAELIAVAGFCRIPPPPSTPPAPPLAPAPACDELENGVDYPGNVLLRIRKIPEADWCLLKCKHTDGCAGFTYVEDMQTCFLKKAMTGRKAWARGVSAVIC